MVPNKRKTKLLEWDDASRRENLDTTLRSSKAGSFSSLKQMTRRLSSGDFFKGLRRWARRSEKKRCGSKVVVDQLKKQQKRRTRRMADRGWTGFELSRETVRRHMDRVSKPLTLCPKLTKVSQKLKGTRLHWRRAVRRSLLCAFGHRVDGDVRRLLADVVFRNVSSMRLDCNMQENAQNNRVWLARASPKNTPFTRTTSRVGRSLRGDFLVWSENANSHTTWTPQESLGTCELCLLIVECHAALSCGLPRIWLGPQSKQSNPGQMVQLFSSSHCF